MLSPDARPSQTGFVPQEYTVDQEPMLEAREAIEFMNRLNADNAAAVWQVIQNRYAINPPSEEMRPKFSVELDSLSTELMEQGLHSSSGFITRVRGCEGAKEAIKYGDQAKVPLLDGHYGLGHKVDFSAREELVDHDQHDVIEMVIDPIEGTTNASNNRVGSISVMGGIINGQVMRIPTENQARYMDRVLASSRVRRLGSSGISLDATPEHNVRAVMRAYGLSSPGDVDVVVMDRPRTQALRDELKRLGVNLWEISSGDLVPALAALTSDRPLLSMGSGGKEEAVIAAIAAKASGGVFEGRYVDKDGAPSDYIPQSLGLDSLLGGSDSDSFVSLASITGTSSYLNSKGQELDLGALTLPPVVQTRRSIDKPHYNVTTAAIGGESRRLQKAIIPL